MRCLGQNRMFGLKLELLDMVAARLLFEDAGALHNGKSAARHLLCRSGCIQIQDVCGPVLSF